MERDIPGLTRITAVYTGPRNESPANNSQAFWLQISLALRIVQTSAADSTGFLHTCLKDTSPNGTPFYTYENPTDSHRTLSELTQVVLGEFFHVTGDGQSEDVVILTSTLVSDTAYQH